MREKFRDSDVELRNSATTRDIDDNNSNKQLIGKSSKRYQYILISSIIFSIAALIAIIITYFLVYKNVNDQVRSISEVFYHYLIISSSYFFYFYYLNQLFLFRLVVIVMMLFHY